MRTPATVTGMHAQHLYQRANEIRANLKLLAEDVNSLRKITGAGELAPEVERGEVIANATIAYRHLEDASMRFGKMLQALDGGMSVYDKTTTTGTPNRAVDDLGEQLLDILSLYVGERGQTEGAVEVLRRIIAERDRGIGNVEAPNANVVATEKS